MPTRLGILLLCMHRIGIEVEVVIMVTAASASVGMKMRREPMATPFLAGGKYFVNDKTDRWNAQYGAFYSALAYWYTGHEKYAERASDILYSFFLMPSTRMSPRLTFAQV